MHVHGETHAAKGSYGTVVRTKVVAHSPFLQCGSLMRLQSLLLKQHVLQPLPFHDNLESCCIWSTRWTSKSLLLPPLLLVVLLLQVKVLPVLLSISLFQLSLHATGRCGRGS